MFVIAFMMIFFICDICKCDCIIKFWRWGYINRYNYIFYIVASIFIFFSSRKNAYCLYLRKIKIVIIQILILNLCFWHKIFNKQTSYKTGRLRNCWTVEWGTRQRIVLQACFHFLVQSIKLNMKILQDQPEKHGCWLLLVSTVFSLELIILCYNYTWVLLEKF